MYHLDSSTYFLIYFSLMVEQPDNWIQNVFDAFKVIKNVDALKQLDMRDKVEQVQQNVATNINTNLLQNEVFETGFYVRDMVDAVDLLVEPGGALDLNQKYLTTSIVSQPILQRAIRAENMKVLHKSETVRKEVCCTLVSCYEPNVVPVFHSRNDNASIFFLHFHLPVGTKSECSKYMNDTRNGVRTNFELRIAKAVQKQMIEDGLITGLSWTTSVWIIVLVVLVSVTLTLVFIVLFFHCRNQATINKWEGDGINNFIVEMQHLKEKSDKKLSSPGEKAAKEEEEK